MQRTFSRLIANSFIVCCTLFLFSSATFSFSVSIYDSLGCFDVSLFGGGVDALFLVRIYSLLCWCLFWRWWRCLSLYSFCGGSPFLACHFFKVCVIFGVVALFGVCDFGVVGLFLGVFYGGCVVSDRFGRLDDADVESLFGGVLNGKFAFCGGMAFSF